MIGIRRISLPTLESTIGKRCQVVSDKTETIRSRPSAGGEED